MKSVGYILFLQTMTIPMPHGGLMINNHIIQLHIIQLPRWPDLL